MAYLHIDNVSKKFGGAYALKDVTLPIAEGGILSLLGPSGCGKTTLLRLIAGLTSPDAGRILLDGADLASVPPHARRFGLMFQEFALFPHKNVFENVAFGLRMQQKKQDEITRRTEEMLTLVGLADFKQRNVADLSGGERQRVALARSLAPQPRLLMLDEPLGALDRTLRQRLLTDLIRILRKVNVTTIFVTHDQAEAFAVADNICVMHAGRIEQTAPPQMLYKHPASVRVASFLGFENLIPGKVIAPGRVETQLGDIFLETKNFSPGRPVTLLLRPEGALPVNYNAADAPHFIIKGTVTDWIFLGPSYRLRLVTEQGLNLCFELPNTTLPLDPGASIELGLAPAACAVI